MKKVLGILALLALLAAVPAPADEGDVWDFDTVSYSLDGYSGEGGDVVIPEEIEGCTVDIIGVNALSGAEGVTSLVLPETVRQIENGAISFCPDLEYIEIPEGVMVIGDNCFAMNPLVEEIVIPPSVCYIGDNSFDSCDSLAEIVFTGECPVFAGDAFGWLPDGAVIYVPDDEYDAYCAAFAGMNLAAEIRTSGEDAERYDFSIDPDQFYFDAETGLLIGYSGYDVRVDVPAEIDGVAVTAIDYSAFEDSQYLCYLTLPEGVELIDESAFAGCSRLLHVEFPSTLKHIGDRAFAGGVQMWSVELPEGLLTIGSEAFSDAVRLTGALRLPEGLETVGEYAFSGCGWLEEIWIPASVRTIGEGAFDWCGANYVVFEGLELPEMPEDLFATCQYLADIDLHPEATKQQMLDLQAVVDGLGLSCRVWRMQNPNTEYITDGLDLYEGGTLVAYTGTQTHVRPWDSTYDGSIVTALGEGVFRDNPYIEYFAVPHNDAFTTIGREAFAGSSLAGVDLFDSVTTIGEGAFRDCALLSELVIPESVTYVGEGAISGCTGLKKLTVLCDPAALPEGFFADCPEGMEIYASPTATDEQVKMLSALAGRPFYLPVTRIGEALPEFVTMAYEPLPGEDFWYDADYLRLDRYEGYERNLFLPRAVGGVTLSMIGGGMMERAAYGDNYEMELPVVSVVIPENYTDIPPYAFMNCETLEVVICYAPIEMLSDCMFQNCTALRQVIFVNGVGGMGQYVFDNCPALESVYVGPYADNFSEFTFLNGDGSVSFAAGDLIRDPAEMPDIDALVESVRCDPMPEPEPEPEPEPIELIPVGDEGAAFFGAWRGTEMDMGGEVYQLSEFEMAFTLILEENGVMLLLDQELTELDRGMVGAGDWLPWRVEEGVALADASSMTILDDGRLCLEEEGLYVYFERADDIQLTGEYDAEAMCAPVAEEEYDWEGEEEYSWEDEEEYYWEEEEDYAPEEESYAPYGDVAYWYEVRFICTGADVDGYTLDASLLGGEYSLVFHEDGTADLVLVGAPVPGLPWSVSDAGTILVDYYGAVMEIFWTEGGFVMDYFGAMMMNFVPEE